jgi:23S rRNA (adenine2503-C2)-methyltransferase
MRLAQTARHYFTHLSRSAADMTDLPAAERQRLTEKLLPDLVRPVTEQLADSGQTIKTLYRLHDATAVETVLMTYPGRATLCLSSQVGCAMGCPFCATGRLGLKRNLSAAEMVDQVRQAAAAVRQGVFGTDGPDRLSNVVFMGMGEPLANYRATVRAVRAIGRPPGSGFGISLRHLTISTCGLVPAIERLAGEGLPVRLALSLHAPDDALRDQLVPVNRRFGVARTLAAAYQYYQATGRRVSIEYALMRDINDQAWRASLLAERLCQYGTGWVHLNPIPLNPVAGSVWTASRPKMQDRFVHRLEVSGLAVTLRETRGQEIDGACGQLAAKEVLN